MSKLLQKWHKFDFYPIKDQDKFGKIINVFYDEFESDPENDFTSFLSQINMRLMEEDLTELADEAKEDEENDDRDDEKKGKLVG